MLTGEHQVRKMAPVTVSLPRLFKCPLQLQMLPKWPRLAAPASPINCCSEQPGGSSPLGPDLSLNILHTDA